MFDWLWRHPRRVRRTQAESALYSELSGGRSLVQFCTPAKGYREHRVAITVDEIEELILAEEERRLGL